MPHPWTMFRWPGTPGLPFSLSLHVADSQASPGPWEQLGRERGRKRVCARIHPFRLREVPAMINPEWEGDVAFYELLFGTWLSYALLVLVWEKLLRRKLDEWKYALITLLGGAAFLINHYFQYSSFWVYLINIYTLAFWIVYCRLSMRGAGGSRLWQTCAAASAILFTFAFIGFEMIARTGVEAGIHEFWFMLSWRGRNTSAQSQPG